MWQGNALVLIEVGAKEDGISGKQSNNCAGKKIYTAYSGIGKKGLATKIQKKCSGILLELAESFANDGCDDAGFFVYVPL